MLHRISHTNDLQRDGAGSGVGVLSSFADLVLRSNVTFDVSSRVSSNNTSVMESFLNTLHGKVSKNTTILTKDDLGFASAYERWSNIDRKMPAIIVQPATEHDVAVLIKAAHEANIPFVPATGGHSTWSSIENGLVIDFSKYKEVVVDPHLHKVAVRGGILMKELQIALSEKKQFTTVANGNTVAVIPYVIGGGISSYSPLIGYACENVLSARIFTANGDIITASDSENQDLLWAIRGAGQFFGIVSEIIPRTYDLSLIVQDGVRQIGVIFFPTERAVEVCQVLKSVVEANSGYASSGHFMAMNDPKMGHVLMVAPQFFGSGPELQKTFKPLTDMEPLHHEHGPSTFEQHSDHRGWMCPKGDFKRFSQTGLASINPENFGKLVYLHRELLEYFPGTERSVFTIVWHTKTPKKGPRETKTSFDLKDVDIWLNILTWYTDPNLHKHILDIDKKAQKMMRSDTKEDAFVAYTNTSRDEPIEYRYKDEAAVRNLKDLKRHLDPDGFFTKELL